MFTPKNPCQSQTSTVFLPNSSKFPTSPPQPTNQPTNQPTKKPTKWHRFGRSWKSGIDSKTNVAVPWIKEDGNGSKSSEMRSRCKIPYVKIRDFCFAWIYHMFDVSLIVFFDFNSCSKDLLLYGFFSRVCWGWGWDGFHFGRYFELPWFQSPMKSSPWCLQWWSPPWMLRWWFPTCSFRSFPTSGWTVDEV